MTEPADGWLKRDGISLHYLEWRPEAESVGPPVLLLHGLSSNAHYWGRLARHLRHRRLIALDQRGHGLTARPPRVPPVPAGFAVDELLGDALLLIRELQLERPLVVGHSWGATVALELVARHPESVSALVFIDGPVQSAANLFSWEDGQVLMQPPLPRYSSFKEAVDDARHDFGSAWEDDLEPFVMSRVMQEGEELILTLTSPIRLELLRGLYESPVDFLWTQVQVPAVALLARGGPSRMAGWREAGVKRLAENAPQVRVEWFDTAHDIPLFAPEAVAAEVEHISEEAARGASSEAAPGQKLEG